MRRLAVTDDHGIFTIQHDGWTTSSQNLETALRRAYEKAAGQPGSPLHGKPITELPYEVSLAAAELLESLMGRPLAGREQIHEGVETA